MKRAGRTTQQQQQRHEEVHTETLKWQLNKGPRWLVLMCLYLCVYIDVGWGEFGSEWMNAVLQFNREKGTTVDICNEAIGNLVLRVPTLAPSPPLQDLRCKTRCSCSDSGWTSNTKWILNINEIPPSTQRPRKTVLRWRGEREIASQLSHFIIGCPHGRMIFHALSFTSNLQAYQSGSPHDRDSTWARFRILHSSLSPSVPFSPLFLIYVDDF